MLTMAKFQAGARMGCSIGAAKKCKPPWWHIRLPFFNTSNCQREDREACEEREMQRCLTDAKAKCASYAKDTCQGGFSEARIVNPHAPLEQKYRFLKRFSREEAVRLMHEDINENTSS